MLATLDTVIALVLTAIALWRIAVLLISGPSPGRVASAVLFAAFAISNGMDAPAVARLLGSSGRIIDNLALIAGFGTFIYFFATQLGEQDRGFIRTRVQVSIAAIAGLGMFGCWVVNPAGVPSYGNLGPSPSLQAGMFYIVGSVYLTYACLAASWLAGRASAHAGTTRSWPFRVCGIALVLNVIGGPLVRTVSISMRWGVGVGLPHGVESVGTWVLAAGILGVDLGLCGIALGAALETRRQNRRVRRDFADLSTLWVLLYDRFPWIALPGSSRRGPRRRTVLLRPIYAFERRCTECRDGLWLLSPWASEDVPGEDNGTEAGLSLEAQARVVYDALGRAAAGEDPVGPPVALAAPASTPAEAPTALSSVARADADQLVGLSRALSAILSSSARPEPAA